MERRRAAGILGGISLGSFLSPAESLSDLLSWADQARAGSAAAMAGVEATASLLTPPRARVMGALADLIIPRTETPGASEAGVVEFVRALVDGWLDDADRDRFLSGLDAVDAEARELFGRDFADLAQERRATFALDLDAELTRLRESPSLDETLFFFHDVKRFSLAGWFTSEAGLQATGYRTTFSAFDGCSPLEEEPAPGENGAAQPRPGPPR